MKSIKVGLAEALTILALTGFARAADTGNITVTVSLQSLIEVTVTPGAWNIGSVALSSVSGPTSFTAAVGNTATKLEIKATNPAGGANAWAIGSAPAADVFQVAVSDPAINLTTGYQTLAGSVTHYGSQPFALTYKAPTSDTKGAETDENFVITVKATWALVTGTVSVNITPDAAQWTLSGPAGFVGNGQTVTGDQTFANAPAGAYTWSGLALAGYDTPATQTQTLAAGTTITFNATWASQSGLIELVSVPAGTFTMGRRDDGDDGTYGYSHELPRHSVTLSAYQIGKYAVTNGQYCEVLNWALAQGYVKGDASGGAYTGSIPFAAGQALLFTHSSYCNVQYSGGVFSSKTRTGAGSVQYSMATHPVVMVTWYGSVVFCNWLSEKEGLTSCYNLTDWSLIQGNNGYRLPTEAEWERAAAWDGAKHWIYGFQSDSISSASCNYIDGLYYDNPLGLTSYPYTSPVGWFNGVNISPNGNVQTVNSPSPVGCYDMSGNVFQWCHDWAGLYSSSAQTNPIGPYSGFAVRILRGGAWYYNLVGCRAAYRNFDEWDPYAQDSHKGFRVVRGVFAP